MDPQSFEITPAEAQSLVDSGEPLFFIDVREPAEWDVARIEGASLVPMGTVPGFIADLENKADEGALIVYCHHGVRSLQVVAWLRDRGIACCYSMAGGIDRWSREVDSSIPRY